MNNISELKKEVHKVFILITGKSALTLTSFILSSSAFCADLEVPKKYAK